MTYKLPEGWKEVKLGEVAEYINDKVSIKECKAGSYISTTNMIQNKGGIVEADKLPKSKTVNSFKKKDILISNIRPYFKKIWFAEFDGTSSTDILVIRGKGKMNEKFLYYALSSDTFFEYATKTAKGTKMPRGDKKAILQYKLPEIDLREQKAIADTLSAIDDKIELNNKINKNLEVQAQAIFKSWFIDFEPLKNGEFVESELGMIPKGWEVVKLGDKFNFVKGKVPKYTDKEQLNSYPYLTKTVLDGAWDEVKYGVDSSGVRCEPLDILMLMDGASSSQIFYGYDGLVGSTLSLIDTKDKNMREILYMYFHVFNNELKNQNTGSAIPHANKDYINNIRIAVPSDESYFKKLADFFMLIRIKILKNKKQNQKLSQLRDTLLTKLMSGEIRIPLDEQLGGAL